MSTTDEAAPVIIPGDVRETETYGHAKTQVDAALAAAHVDGLEVTDEESNARVVAILGRIVSARKDAETRRKAITGPITAAKTKIDAHFKELVGPLDGAEQGLKAQVAIYQRKVEEERRAAEAKAAAEAAERERAAREEADRQRRIEEQKAVLRQTRENEEAAANQREAATIAPDPVPEPEPVIPDAVPEAKKTHHSGGASATVKKVWKAEVIDEAQVPREFCKVHLPAINAAVKNGTRSIPGVRIFEDDQVAVR
jgi:hypothetical protein